MAQQLIFTSAIAGLNPGSSGYCTVARSESMREAVATRLEQWSVYAHTARGPRPVVCAHRILNLRGSNFHVLTRIVDSGLDYTGRTNFLAHHLVLQPHEIHGACSPAEVFSNWKGWLTEWQGAPRYPDDTSFSIHAIPRTTRMPASAWAEAAGDAGAAALLLTDGAGQAGAKSVDLIVPAGFEKGLLRLYAESLYLADPGGENAPAIWAVPFTTFLQAENDPAEFRWRGLWPEDRGRASGGVLCDFVNGHIPLIAAGFLADYARTGQPKTAARPNIAAGHLSPVVIGQPTTALNMPTAALTGIRRTGRPPARAASASNPSTRWGRRGMPRWAWISLLIVIPAGIAAGWFFAKGDDVNITSNSGTTVQTRRSEAAAATPQMQSRSPISLASPQLSINQATPDPAELQRKQQLATIFAELDNGRAVEDPHSALNSTRAQELAKLKTLLSNGATSDLQVSGLHKEVADINQAIAVSNSDYDNYKALETLPHGLVYVVVAPGRKAELLDLQSPLKAWVEGISNNSVKLGAYNVFVRHSSTVEPNEKQIQLERDAESGSGNLVSESLQYTISPGFIESAEGWGSEASTWLYFAPATTTSLPVFNVLVAGAKPMFSISSSAAIEWQSEPPEVRFKPGVEQLLTERLKKWKSSEGNPLDFCLEIQMRATSNPMPVQDGLVFTFQTRAERQRALQNAVENLQKAEQNIAVAAQTEQSISASQAFFSKLTLSPQTVKALNNQTGFGSEMNGARIYHQVGDWVAEICNDYATSESVLPSDCPPGKRVASIQEAIPRLNALAGQKAHFSQSANLTALASDLARVSWQDHAALLSGSKTNNVLQTAEAELKKAQDIKQQAQTALDQSPDLNSIGKIWICWKTDGTNISPPIRIIEVVMQSVVQNSTAMSLKY